jgi:hypothetical protein
VSAPAGRPVDLRAPQGEPCSFTGAVALRSRTGSLGSGSHRSSCGGSGGHPCFHAHARRHPRGASPAWKAATGPFHTSAHAGHRRCGSWRQGVPDEPRRRRSSGWRRGSVVRGTSWRKPAPASPKTVRSWRVSDHFSPGIGRRSGPAPVRAAGAGSAEGRPGQDDRHRSPGGHRTSPRRRARDGWGTPDADGGTRAVVTPDLPVLTSGSEP